jgi:tetratricopeptide (TPR) repeat protein
MFRVAGDQVGEARTLTNLGIACESLGDLADAADHLETARIICTEIDLPDGLARALGVIAGVYRAQGRLVEASASYERALGVFRNLGDRVGEATTLTNLGVVLVAQGRPAEAVDLHEQALDMSDEIGDQATSTEILNNFGSALSACGRVAAAAGRHQEALVRAGEPRNLVEIARAHAGLAVAYARMAEGTLNGARDERRRLARQHLDTAADHFGELGIPGPAEMVGLAAQLRAD